MLPQHVWASKLSMASDIPFKNLHTQIFVPAHAVHGASPALKQHFRDSPLCSSKRKIEQFTFPVFDKPWYNATQSCVPALPSRGAQQILKIMFFPNPYVLIESTCNSKTFDKLNAKNQNTNASSRWPGPTRYNTPHIVDSFANWHCNFPILYKTLRADFAFKLLQLLAIRHPLCFASKGCAKAHDKLLKKYDSMKISNEYWITRF